MFPVYTSHSFTGHSLKNLVHGEELSQWQVAIRDFRETSPANIFIPTLLGGGVIHIKSPRTFVKMLKKKCLKC